MFEDEVKKEKKDNKKAESKPERHADCCLRGKVVDKNRVIEAIELRRRADGHWYTPDGREAVLIARIGDAEGEVR